MVGLVRSQRDWNDSSIFITNDSKCSRNNFHGRLHSLHVSSIWLYCCMLAMRLRRRQCRWRYLHQSQIVYFFQSSPSSDYKLRFMEMLIRMRNYYSFEKVIRNHPVQIGSVAANYAVAYLWKIISFGVFFNRIAFAVLVARFFSSHSSLTHGHSWLRKLYRSH